MSVALMTKRRGDAGSELTPVATQDVFVRRWLPGSRALGLRWVPMFETGTPVTADDIPDIVAELRALLTWMQRNAPEQEARLGGLLAALERLRDEPDVDIYIG